MVFCSRWRNTWPISPSDAPCLSIPVAARMAQTVRADSGQSGPVACGADDPPDRAAVQSLAWRGHPQEQLPAPAARATAKIGHDRLADIDGQRQHIVTAALATNEQLAATPVDVIEPRSRRPPRRAARAATTATGSRSHAGRPTCAGHSWPRASSPPLAPGRAGSVRSRRSATEGTAHTSGASISPARCR